LANYCENLFLHFILISHACVKILHCWLKHASFKKMID
jgi:hypothetical protein